MKYLWILVLLAIGGGVAWRFTKQAESAERASAPLAPLQVRVVSPTVGPKVQKVSFPGTVRPVDLVTLYARSNGFVHGLVVDLGDRVKKGQVLAQLDAPDLAASLAQARARLEQAKATLTLVRAQHERTKALATSGNLSPQDVDSSSLKVTTAESDVATNSAEAERLGALVSYLTVRAPFDGIITRRYVDDGALVSQERTALFDMGTQSLQIDVDVPQWSAGQIAVGDVAEITTNGKATHAKVNRTAGVLDPATRTLKTELLPEPGAPLVPGSFVHVIFSIPREDPPLIVPGSALSIRGGNMNVVAVTTESKVHLVPVKIARELGRDVELIGELTTASRVVLYPPASLQEGDAVTLAPETPRAL